MEEMRETESCHLDMCHMIQSVHEVWTPGTPVRVVSWSESCDHLALVTSPSLGWGQVWPPLTPAWDGTPHLSASPCPPQLWPVSHWGSWQLRNRRRRRHPDHLYTRSPLALAPGTTQCCHDRTLEMPLREHCIWEEILSNMLSTCFPTSSGMLTPRTRCHRIFLMVWRLFPGASQERPPLSLFGMSCPHRCVCTGGCWHGFTLI